MILIISIVILFVLSSVIAAFFLIKKKVPKVILDVDVVDAEDGDGIFKIEDEAKAEAAKAEAAKAEAAKAEAAKAEADFTLAPMGVGNVVTKEAKAEAEAKAVEFCSMNCNTLGNIDCELLCPVEFKEAVAKAAEDVVLQTAEAEAEAEAKAKAKAKAKAESLERLQVIIDRSRKISEEKRAAEEAAKVEAAKVEAAKVAKAEAAAIEARKLAIAKAAEIAEKLKVSREKMISDMNIRNAAALAVAKEKQDKLDAQKLIDDKIIEDSRKLAISKAAEIAEKLRVSREKIISAAKALPTSRPSPINATDYAKLIADRRASSIARLLAISQK